MDDFGRRLRSLRRERGLSQGDVGGQRYSASYVSHLESGRRPPTPEIVEHLAERLGVDAADLLGVDLEAYADTTSAVRLALAQFRATAAWNDRDYEAVVALTIDAAVAANRLERPDAWWNLTFRMAEALLMLERHAECVSAAGDLVRHRVANLAPDLRTEALALSSKASRAGGDLATALTTAEAATAAAVDSRNPISMVTALLAEVAACAELGHLERAAHAAARLDEARDRMPDTQLAGLAAWSIGNVAFLQGDVARGVAEHTRAAGALRPDSDLRAWGRFNKASASMRLKAGVRDGLEELLDNAGYALTLVGNEGDRQELLLVRAEVVVEDDPQQALSLTEGLRAEATTAPDNTLAEVAMVRARAHRALGRSEEERAELEDAAQRFEAAGAERRALEVWRQLAGFRSTTSGPPA